MRNERLKKFIKLTLWTFGGLFLFLAAVFFTVLPGGSGVLASLRTPDGSEYMVTQRCNLNLAEPYTVSFYMRSPGGWWGWCYIDHQAMRWAHVAMHYDPATEVISATALGIRRAALDRKRNMFWIGTFREGREVPAPQDYYEPEFPFP